MGWCAKCLTALAAFLALEASLANVAADGAGGGSAAQCWTARDLMSRGPSEKRVRRGDRRFDSPPDVTDVKPLDVAEGESGVIRRVSLPEDKKWIALTLDFCEQAGEVSGYDGEIIDILRAEGVAATLFVGGKWMRSHPERTEQLIADPLFEVGSHGEAHRDVRRLSAARLRVELLAPQVAYREARQRLSKRACFSSAPERLQSVSERMGLFRFPYGTCDRKALEAVKGAGMRAVQWDISTGDAWPGQSARRIARTVLQRVRPGSIILAHANGRGWHTAAGLKELIPELKKQGYAFVTLSKLLKAGEPEVVERCYDTRPGDTNRWPVGRPAGKRLRSKQSQPIQRL